MFAIYCGIRLLLFQAFRHRAMINHAMANFDERSGIIPSITDWGHWCQTLEEIFIEIAIPTGTSVKEIKCLIKPKHIKIEVRSRIFFEGELFSVIHADDSIWTFGKPVMLLTLFGMNISKNTARDSSF
ncbi:NudC domain-containing protein 2 [Mizuhopecten yessoensis]|uniref:NudC domain-containing protein 2 n=1 Tax=Mizuhopecten yessoensis TaxID=6573 RepID=A0A210Q2K8_MIZYE|nr:NudC domain-containing protein 2 [Mizuhopecten yessoensis]